MLRKRFEQVLRVIVFDGPNLLLDPPCLIETFCKENVE